MILLQGSNKVVRNMILSYSHTIEVTQYLYDAYYNLVVTIQV